MFYHSFLRPNANVALLILFQESKLGFIATQIFFQCSCLYNNNRVICFNLFIYCQSECHLLNYDVVFYCFPRG